MRFQIKHEMRGRLRIHVIKSRMTCEEADMLQYYLTQIEGVEQAKVYERTGDASVVYTTDRQVLLEKLQQFRFDSSLVPKEYLAHSGRGTELRLSGKAGHEGRSALCRKIICAVFHPGRVDCYQVREISEARVQTLAKAVWRYRYWMRPPSGYPYSAAI